MGDGVLALLCVFLFSFLTWVKFVAKEKTTVWIGNNFRSNMKIHNLHLTPTTTFHTTKFLEILFTIDGN